MKAVLLSSVALAALLVSAAPPSPKQPKGKMLSKDCPKDIKLDPEEDQGMDGPPPGQAGPKPGSSKDAKQGVQKVSKPGAPQQGQHARDESAVPTAGSGVSSRSHPTDGVVVSHSGQILSTSTSIYPKATLASESSILFKFARSDDPGADRLSPLTSHPPLEEMADGSTEAPSTSSVAPEAKESALLANPEAPVEPDHTNKEMTDGSLEADPETSSTSSAAQESTSTNSETPPEAVPTSDDLIKVMGNSTRGDTPMYPYLNSTNGTGFMATGTRGAGIHGTGSFGTAVIMSSTASIDNGDAPTDIANPTADSATADSATALETGASEPTTPMIRRSPIFGLGKKKSCQKGQQFDRKKKKCQPIEGYHKDACVAPKEFVAKKGQCCKKNMLGMWTQCVAANSKTGGGADQGATSSHSAMPSSTVHPGGSNGAGEDEYSQNGRGVDNSNGQHGGQSDPYGASDYDHGNASPSQQHGGGNQNDESLGGGQQQGYADGGSSQSDLNNGGSDSGYGQSGSNEPGSDPGYDSGYGSEGEAGSNYAGRKDRRSSDPEDDLYEGKDLSARWWRKNANKDKYKGCQTGQIMDPATRKCKNDPSYVKFKNCQKGQYWDKRMQKCQPEPGYKGNAPCPPGTEWNKQKLDCLPSNGRPNGGDQYGQNQGGGGYNNNQAGQYNHNQPQQYNHQQPGPHDNNQQGGYQGGGYGQGGSPHDGSMNGYHGGQNQHGGPLNQGDGSSPGNNENGANEYVDGSGSVYGGDAGGEPGNADGHGYDGSNDQGGGGGWKRHLHTVTEADKRHTAIVRTTLTTVVRRVASSDVPPPVLKNFLEGVKDTMVSETKSAGPEATLILSEMSGIVSTAMHVATDIS